MIETFCKFSLIGVAATALHYAILMGLVELCLLDVVLASSAGFAVSSLFNYTLNYRITFNSRKRHRETCVRFFSIALIGLWLNGTILTFFNIQLRWHYLFAQAAATMLVLFWNFTGNLLWTFKET